MGTDFPTGLSPHQKVSVMNNRSDVGQDEDLMKGLYTKEGWRTYCEGMESDEISLGTMEDGLYLRGERKGVFLL